MKFEFYLKSQLQRLRALQNVSNISTRSHFDYLRQNLPIAAVGVRYASSIGGEKERPKHNISFDYSGNKSQNPEYMVSEDISFSDEMMRTIQIPILTNDAKEEMYTRYIEEGLDFIALSNQYRTSFERTRAVIYMMERKEALLREEGLLCFIPVRKGKVETEEEQLMRARSELWDKIFLEYEEEIAKFLRLKEEAEDAAEASLPNDREKLKFVKAQLKEAMAEFNDVKGLRVKELEYHNKLAAELAERYSVSKEEVDTAVVRMRTHYDRMEELLEREEENNKFKAQLAESGRCLHHTPRSLLNYLILYVCGRHGRFQLPRGTLPLESRRHGAVVLPRAVHGRRLPPREEGLLQAAVRGDQGPAPGHEVLPRQVRSQQHGRCSGRARSTERGGGSQSAGGKGGASYLHARSVGKPLQAGLQRFEQGKGSAHHHPHQDWKVRSYSSGID